jgi:NADH:ubiquinone oxidoreductase subunit 3 (subunit A)
MSGQPTVPSSLAGLQTIIGNPIFTTATNNLISDSGALRGYLNDYKTDLVRDITKQNSSAFQNTYGQLTNAIANSTTTNDDKENATKLDTLLTNVFKNQQGSANAVQQDENLANRKYEMNEWSVGNKKDTLFVFSMLFILLSFLVLFTVLWRLRLISSSVWVLLSAPLIIIFICTVIIRSSYTHNVRNNRYWNKKNSNKYAQIPISICPQ